MTPSEKKAREIFGSVLHHTVEEELWRIGDAMEVAERRGFERAKRMAVELCESLGNTSYSKETRVQIFENLKYEEA